MSIERARADLAADFQARRSEIRQAVLTRIYAVADPTRASDPSYLEGLRTALTASLDYGLAALERGEQRAPPVPPAILTQARLAAQSGVTLDTALRRCFAGYTLLGEFILDAAESASIPSAAVRQVMRELATLFDRFVTAVAEEYKREESQRLDSTEQRRAARIERLLAGEILDTSDLSYDLEGFHTGAIAHGHGAADAIRDLAGLLDCRLLLVCRGGDDVWAWFGSRGRLDPAELVERSASWSTSGTLAIGEPGDGLVGWRLTHRQAAAALTIGLRSRDAVVRYADVALLASARQDDLLATTLHQLYLAPLEEDRDGGETARETLRAYFTAGRNVSSAAAALGVNRHTVTTRLRSIEDRFGFPIASRTADLELALQLA